eukprot:2966429-Pyramimonas_sp.AAC.1
MSRTLHLSLLTMLLLANWQTVSINSPTRHAKPLNDLAPTSWMPTSGSSGAARRPRDQAESIAARRVGPRRCQANARSRQCCRLRQEVDATTIRLIASKLVELDAVKQVLTDWMVECGGDAKFFHVSSVEPVSRQFVI